MRADFVAKVWADGWEDAEYLIYKHLRRREREMGEGIALEADGPYDSLESACGGIDTKDAKVEEVLGAGGTPFYFAVVMVATMRRRRP